METITPKELKIERAKHYNDNITETQCELLEKIHLRLPRNLSTPIPFKNYKIKILNSGGSVSNGADSKNIYITVKTNKISFNILDGTSNPLENGDWTPWAINAYCEDREVEAVLNVIKIYITGIEFNEKLQKQKNDKEKRVFFDKLLKQGE